MAWEPPRLKLGLVGCSWFALRAHVPALLALEQRVGVRLTAVCSRTRKSMARAEAKIHAADPEREVRRFAKMEQLFADADVDAVLLVLPIPLMPAAVEAALRAGKHVLSEKPAAPSIEAARRLLDAIAELGPRAPVWLVLENWQFKPSVRWLRERLQEGAIGRVVSAHLSHHHPADPADRAAGGGREPPWRSQAGEGAWLVDAGVHWARLLREALGEPVEGSAALCSGADGAGGGSLCGWVRFEHCSSAATLALSSGGPRRASSSSAAAPPSLILEGELGALCLWAAEEGGGHRCGRARVALERFGGEATTQLLDGDGWVEGGVAESLEHALTAVRALVVRRAGLWPASLATAGRCLLGSCSEPSRNLPAGEPCGRAVGHPLPARLRRGAPTTCPRHVHDTPATRPLHARYTPATRPRHDDTSATRPRHVHDTPATRPRHDDTSGRRCATSLSCRCCSGRARRDGWWLRPRRSRRQRVALQLRRCSPCRPPR